jgi:hypothetical protein
MCGQGLSARARMRDSESVGPRLAAAAARVESESAVRSSPAPARPGKLAFQNFDSGRIYVSAQSVAIFETCNTWQGEPFPVYNSLGFIIEARFRDGSVFHVMRRPQQPHAQLQSELDVLLDVLPLNDAPDEVKQVCFEFWRWTKNVAQHP